MSLEIYLQITNIVSISDWPTTDKPSYWYVVISFTACHIFALDIYLTYYLMLYNAL